MTAKERILKNCPKFVKFMYILGAINFKAYNLMSKGEIQLSQELMPKYPYVNYIIVYRFWHPFIMFHFILCYVVLAWLLGLLTDGVKGIGEAYREVTREYFNTPMRTA